MSDYPGKPVQQVGLAIPGRYEPVTLDGNGAGTKTFNHPVGFYVPDAQAGVIKCRCAKAPTVEVEIKLLAVGDPYRLKGKFVGLVDDGTTTQFGGFAIYHDESESAL